jgi:hypothetical protein
VTTYATPGQLPIPEGGEAADGPAQIGALADRLADLLEAHTTATRDALAGTDLWTGRTLWNVTTARLEVWDGDSWEPVADLTAHTAASDPHTGYVRKATATAKGDLYVATASGVITRKAVGADGRVLVADSAQADGLSWADLSGTYQPLSTALWVGASAMEPWSGSPSIGGVGTAWSAWLLDASVQEGVGGTVVIPTGWATYNVTLVWTNAGAGSGNCLLESFHDQAAPGDTLTFALVDVTVAAPAQNVLKETVLASGLACTPGQLTNVAMRRHANQAADTLGNDIGVLGIRLNKAS